MVDYTVCLGDYGFPFLRGGFFDIDCDDSASGGVEVGLEQVREMLKGDSEPVLPAELEDIESLQGVKNFPVRVKCALLAWVTLIEGLKNYESDAAATQATVTTEEDEKNDDNAR